MMKVTHLEAAVEYIPPEPYDCFVMHLQQENLGCEATYWFSCSYSGRRTSRQRRFLTLG